MNSIADMPQWLVDLIEEKAKNPANFDGSGRLCIAPGVHVRPWLTEREKRLMEEPAEGTS